MRLPRCSLILMGMGFLLFGTAQFLLRNPSVPIITPQVARIQLGPPAAAASELQQPLNAAASEPRRAAAPLVSELQRTTAPVRSELNKAAAPPPPSFARPALNASSCAEDQSISFGPLELNQHAKRLWGCASKDASVRAVFLTFGSASMADFLLNWVAHVRRLGERLYLVGALDAKIAALCDELGIPAATISNERLTSLGVRTLGASSGYYRYHPGTFLRMGLIKQVIIKQMLLAGLDAMVSDVDVAWLSSPWPLVRYGDASQPVVRPSARLLAYADVILSVDQVQQYMDTDRHHWHVHSELNTGVVFFRNSPVPRLHAPPPRSRSGPPSPP